jgi:hypothetical protein
MSQLRARAVDRGELDGAVELLGHLSAADEARRSLARLSGLDEKSLSLGDGWAATVELDGVSLFVRGEPAGSGAFWTISAAPGVESGKHAAHRLQNLIAGTAGS